MHIVTQIIGQEIKVRRNILQLGQADLSEISGVSLRTIIQLENGKGNPSLVTLHKLLEVLGLELRLGLKHES